MVSSTRGFPPENWPPSSPDKALPDAYVPIRHRLARHIEKSHHGYMVRSISLGLVLCVLLSACGDSVKPQKTTGVQPQPYDKNATDAVGVAQGDKQVSPFGKPAN